MKKLLDKDTTPGEFIRQHNLLVESHNDVCRAHDLLVEEVKAMGLILDQLSEQVFKNPSELDS